jgi:hypothetical protein
MTQENGALSAIVAFPALAKTTRTIPTVAPGKLRKDTKSTAL